MDTPTHEPDLDVITIADTERAMRQRRTDLQQSIDAATARRRDLNADIKGWRADLTVIDRLLRVFDAAAKKAADTKPVDTKPASNKATPK